MQADGFRDLELLGSGTQGRVYSAFDDKLEHAVVIKRIDASTPSQQDRLKNEIVALKGCTHPHILPVLYALLRPQMTLIVSPLGRGNLLTIMPMRYDLAIQTSAFHTLTAQMLSALDYLQQEGISHGNIKPTNILAETVTRYGCFFFQLVDFAYAEGTYEAPPHCRGAASVYRAPEAYAETHCPLGPKEDVWSLFVTLAVACGRLSEAELVRKGHRAASRDVVEAGVRMAELEGMARQNPTLRASAREVMARLRPGSLGSAGGAGLAERGEAVGPDFSSADSYTYGDGSYDAPPTPSPRVSPIPRLPVPGRYTYLPPINSIPDPSASPPALRLPPLPPLSPPYPSQASPPLPPFSPPYPSQAAPSQQPQPRTSQFDPVDQRCLASCCNTPRSLPTWTSTSISASILTSVSVTARLAPFKPLSPFAPSFFPVCSARQTPATQQASLTETWNIWGVCDSRNRNSTNDANRVAIVNLPFLITNLDYLPGLLTLNHSLRRAGSKYPLVALYTDAFPQAGHDALRARGIPSQRIEYLVPAAGRDYSHDPRFYDCWSKLVPFSLTQYARIVQLDSDMLVLRNMDELMDLELDPPGLAASSGDASSSRRVFAAGHACVCNPLRKPHYPRDWIPDNCAFTSQHADPDAAQTVAADPSAGPLGFMNGGLQVVNPSEALYGQIVAHMEAGAADMDFADQSLLSDLYRGRWVPLPYTYNALKTMRWEGVHDRIWRDDRVKNVHYILSPKPWDEIDDRGEWTGSDESHKWWVDANRERKAADKEAGIDDDF
ncbi:hypothetical protein J3F83DRAFT_762289 [Trichoderma novae-zelandiae]